MKALRTMVERECYWNNIKIGHAQKNNKQYVIFPAGLYAQKFYEVLKKECRIDIAFFVDNNPKLANTFVCGKEIKSFESVFTKESCNEYFVLIPTVDIYYRQIAKQLDDVGCGVAYVRGDTYLINHLLERYKNVADLLEDDFSKISYWGAVYNLLTGDNRFILTDPAPQYHGINEFSYLENEIVVDAGAYVGDSIEGFISRSKIGNIKIYAFEPLDELIVKINKRTNRINNEWALDDGIIEVIHAGLGVETKKQLFTYASASVLTYAETGGMEILIYSLDDYFHNKTPFTFLKADIEGGEMDMLIGAREIIKKYKPKMALSIYHLAIDFIRIAEYIQSLTPEYRFYIRTHFFDYRDTILYCVI